MILVEFYEHIQATPADVQISQFGESDRIAVNDIDRMGYNAKIVGYLIFVPLICMFGIVGNIINIIVLHKGPFKGAAYVYLKGLALYDMLSLIFILPICVIRCPLCTITGYSWRLYEAYIYIPVGDIFLKASVITTLVFTIERCIIICFNNRFHFEVKKTRSAIVTVAVIGILCTLENLPTFWMYSINNQGTVEQTDFSHSTFFIFYGWFDAVVFQFIPMIILFTFNIILIIYLRAHRQLQRQIVQTPVQIAEQKFNIEQTRMIFLLIGIIVLFLVTMVPSSVMQLIGYSIQFGSDVYTNFQVTTTVLIALNFTCNFLLYCAINKRFWRTFKHIFCCCCNNQVHPEADTMLTGHMRPTPATFRHSKTSDARNTSTHRERSSLRKGFSVAGPSFAETTKGPCHGQSEQSVSASVRDSSGQRNGDLQNFRKITKVTVPNDADGDSNNSKLCSETTVSIIPNGERRQQEVMSSDEVASNKYQTL